MFELWCDRAAAGVRAERIPGLPIASRLGIIRTDRQHEARGRCASGRTIPRTNGQRSARSGTPPAGAILRCTGGHGSSTPTLRHRLGQPPFQPTDASTMRRPAPGRAHWKESSSELRCSQRNLRASARPKRADERPKRRSQVARRKPAGSKRTGSRRSGLCALHLNRNCHRPQPSRCLMMSSRRSRPRRKSARKLRGPGTSCPCPFRRQRRGPRLPPSRQQASRMPLRKLRRLT